MIAGHDAVIVLHEKYDPNQLWLPLPTTFIYNSEQIATDNRQALPPRKTIATVNNEWAGKRSGHSNDLTLLDITDHIQLTLRFPGLLRVSNSKLDKVRNAGWPGWDLVDNRPSIIVFEARDKTEIIRWCEDNCRHFYNVRGHYPVIATFASAVDAVTCRLRFG